MPIDEFKTQVLLLHSEQSSLDELGSRFNDRYTIHFATSGSQALSTLAETPINVIISAHDLPGMSGLEALREARKRSPDTIGILLTGNDEDGSEAFVGDEEVFHVVRNNIAKDSLLELVESATKKMRLMTLAESANDTKALGEDSAEHVVMETADNGLPVSTSASGRMPALDPATLASVRPVDVLVLTRDDNFVQTDKASSRGLHTVHSALTLGDANAVMRKEKIGVAVIDAAMVRDKVEQLTHHLRKEVPRLVAVVAGRRDDGDMLMDLINRGKVYRFLVKPVTPGRARLAVEAAVKHHLEAPDAAFKVPDDVEPADVASETPDTTAGDAPEAEKQAALDATASEPLAETPVATDEPIPAPAESAPAVVPEAELPDTGLDPPALNQSTRMAQRMQKLAAARLESQAAAGGHWPRLIAIGAAAVVTIAGALLWFSNYEAETAAAIESLTTSPPVIEAAIVVDESIADTGVIDLEALLATPRSARDIGAIYEPPGSNAIELYQAVVIASEHAPLAVEEFEAVIGQALALAETALLESRLDDAEQALQRVGDADANNARLPFLSAQLQQARLLETLGEARAAIRETRFQDAARLLAAADALQVTDSTEIDAVAAELDRARGEQRADKLLALADARLEAGDLLIPANENARHYYELVLSNDPDNKAARQGLNVIASRLILQARAGIDSGDFANAEMLLGEVRVLDPQNSQLLATAEALNNGRETALAESAAGNTDTDGTRLDPPPVAVSSLVRTRYVAPKYPRSAQRRNLSGWVDITFTVAVDGTVKDVGVRESEPGATFDNAAMRAVEKWEFEPVLSDGIAIEQRVAVRMMFALE